MESTDSRSDRGIPFGLIAFLVDNIGIFSHFGQNGAEQKAVLQQSEPADLLFDTDLLAVIEAKQIGQIGTHKQVGAGAGI